MVISADKQTGRYVYQLNGEPVPVQEFWRRQRRTDGSVCVTSGRRAGAVAIDTEAREVAHRIESFSAQWREEGGRELSVDYRLQGQVLHVARREGGRVQAKEVDCSAEYTLLFPLMRIYVGSVLESLLAAGGHGCVILPEIGVAPDSEQLFEPRLSERRAELVASEVLQDASGVSRNCRRCLYLGDQYDQEASFWLGEDHLLERYQWRQDASRLWDVTLFRDD
ncbi:Uncharacterised protein [Halioglobus japonicus]|nr:Uncharacterised protein [Halioglobus japonicus]